MLTISRLSRWSIRYYNETADEAGQSALDRPSSSGGLGEYCAKDDTRVPTWIVVGDTPIIGAATGLDGAALDGGYAEKSAAARWLDDGIAPSGMRGRAFSDTSVHGFDLVFAAPKSVSLLRALTDDVAEKVMAIAHTRAIKAAMTYLHQHAGYTRVHNAVTGEKDMQRLPGLVAVAYQHETSRCGDPHLHTHVILPNRQPRADGALVSIDSKSLHHEAKAAGIVYQAVLRHELHAERGFEWTRVDEHSGMAEIAGVDRTPSRRGRGAPPACGNGRGTIWWSSTASRRRRRRPPPRKPLALTNPSRWRGRRSKTSGAAIPAACCLIGTRTLRRAQRAAPRRAPRQTARASRRWPRASTRRPSRAPTWSNWSGAAARRCARRPARTHRADR